jgi:6-phosphofructokinase
MKLTETKLREIIKEEIQKLNESKITKILNSGGFISKNQNKHEYDYEISLDGIIAVHKGVADDIVNTLKKANIKAKRNNNKVIIDDKFLK